MRPLHILLAEDDFISAWITQESLKSAPFSYTLHVVRDGEEALRYLLQKEEFSQVPTTDLVILDLNMPIKDGLEVLQHMRQQKSLAKTPVIILTTSAAQRDIEATFKANAGCYINKPFDEHQLLKAIEIIKQTWLPSYSTC